MAGVVGTAQHRLTSISKQMQAAIGAADDADVPPPSSAGSAAGWREGACGITVAGDPIPVYQRLSSVQDAHHLLLLVPAQSAGAVVSALAPTVPLCSTISVAAVQSSWLTDCAYPPDSPPALRFHDPEHPESRYIWRWAGFSGIDTIVQLDLTGGAKVAWRTNRAAPPAIASALGATPTLNGLLTGFGARVGPPSGPQNGLGPIPGYLLSAPDAAAAVAEVTSLLGLEGVVVGSPSRIALVERAARTPLQVAGILAAAYGHALDGPKPNPDTGALSGGVGYVQGVGISGRLRLAQLAGGNDGIPPQAATVQSIVDLVEDYASGIRPLWTDRALLPGSGGPTMAALVWCGELADVTGDTRYKDLLMDAASKYAARELAGACPYPADADFRTEDMFFHSAILGRASAVTGDLRYLEMATGSMTTPCAETLVRVPPTWRSCGDFSLSLCRSVCRCVSLSLCLSVCLSVFFRLCLFVDTGACNPGATRFVLALRRSVVEVGPRKCIRGAGVFRSAHVPPYQPCALRLAASAPPAPYTADD